MRKKICGLLLFGAALLAGTAGVHAETSYGSPDWNVTFTEDEKMESSFSSADLDDTIYGLQPGDNAIITLKLKNEHDVSTDWYMTNKVLYSLEDRSKNQATGGGAYTYILTYTDGDGEKKTLFNSDTVGGENSGAAGEGLHAAASALKDYFFLDTLNKGDGGTVTLEVALDGETQGNDYQDTLADLSMNFAVELNGTPGMSAESPSGGALGETPVEGPGQEGGTDTARDNGRRRTVVQTGDDTMLAPYIIAASISGSILFVLAVYMSLRSGRQKRRALQ